MTHSIRLDRDCCILDTRAADATRLAKELGAAYDLVVCSGGDGTLSEVLDGVMTIDEKKTSKDWLHSGRLH